MNISVYIAKRYLISKKSHNIIHLISWISVIGIAMSTMALIVVLSVFNGFGGLILSLYNSFDPDIQITSVQGKSFALDDFPIKKLKGLSGVAYYSPVLEEEAILKYEDKQYIATLKGVSSDFAKVTDIDSLIVQGRGLSGSSKNDFAIFGYMIAYHLNIRMDSYDNPLSIYIPKREGDVSFDPLSAFNSGYIVPSGVFSVQQDFDSKYILVPIGLVRDLTNKPGYASAIEVSVVKNAEIEEVQQAIQEIVGGKYLVKTNIQMHDFLYKILKYEKWAVYLILSFIMLLAVFNVVGSLSMLVIEKKKDAVILRSMGASNILIKRIFYIEGLLISLTGALFGIIIGFVFCLIQQYTGFVKMGNGSGIFIDAFPVKMEFMDFVSVFITVLIMGMIAAWFPIRKISKEYIDNFRDLSVR